MSARERVARKARFFHATHAEYTPDGKKLIVVWSMGHDECEAVLVDVASGKTVSRLAKTIPDSRYGLQWNRAGTRALTSPDGLHRLWDVEHGRPLQTIGRVDGRSDRRITIYPSSSVSFSDNGRFVYIYGRQFGTFFWDARTGAALNHNPPGEDAANKRSLLVVDNDECDRLGSPNGERHLID